MEQSRKTIKGFIIGAAILVSLVVFFSMYMVLSNTYNRTTKENAIEVSRTLAETTFNSMFQIMSQGWNRTQLESFLAALQTRSDHHNHAIQIYRSQIVSELFGDIEQPAFDALIRQTFRERRAIPIESDQEMRYTYPLLAQEKCLQCHTNAQLGDVLGVIEVRQNLAPMLEQAQSQLLLSLLLVAPLPILLALGLALALNYRVKHSIATLEQYIDKVNTVSDLTNIELKSMDLGFREFNSIFHQLEELTAKMRTVAVDKDLLEFEIRLLEKFVITSEVVKDWREYISYLLVDINQVISAYNLFSIFKIDDELFDLEIFWLHRPDDETRQTLEQAIIDSLRKTPSFDGLPAVTVNHNIAEPTGPTVTLRREEIELQTKSLIVDTPKIGGIVGIGVNANITKDQMRVLVMESILSTLLNVVGSVKAIYKYTKDLEYYATRDPLTHLYNQRMFWELLDYEMSRGDRHQYRFSLLVIDLDNFKSINDSYGHSFGDRFLQAFAEQLEGGLRKGDMLARYGGDEFVAILPEADLEQASTVCRRLLQRLDAFTLPAPDNTAVKATISIGIAVYPDHAKDRKDLFMFADNMMYKAKEQGKNRYCLPSEEDVVEIFRDIGEKSLIVSKAIEEKRVIPFFQPIIAAASGEVAAVEVLSRIQLEGDRVLGAHEFIEIAEKTGQIHQLDYLVMEKAFSQAQACDYAGLIFINLSPRALLLNEFIPKVQALVRHFDIAPQRVVFEITERDTVKNLSLLEKFVLDLKMEGFKLAIDDFGSGFSSFHYLKRFPIDIVKIEGEFVANMANDSRDAAFVRSIADLAHQLGAQTVAEFVEDAEVLRAVRAAGITMAQGYHISRPGPELIAPHLAAHYPHLHPAPTD